MMALILLSGVVAVWGETHLETQLETLMSVVEEQSATINALRQQLQESRRRLGQTALPATALVQVQPGGTIQVNAMLNVGGASSTGGAACVCPPAPCIASPPPPPPPPVPTTPPPPPPPHIADPLIENVQALFQPRDVAGRPSVVYPRDDVGNALTYGGDSANGIQAAGASSFPGGSVLELGGASSNTKFVEFPAGVGAETGDFTLEIVFEPTAQAFIALVVRSDCPGRNSGPSRDAAAAATACFAEGRVFVPLLFRS